MKMRMLWTILMSFALTCTLAISAGAQDRDDHNQQVAQDHDRDQAARDQWEMRNGWEYRTYEKDQHPEGWSHGKRAEASYCEGHNGCYRYEYQGQPYYYYRDENGRLIVRREHRDQK